MSKNMSTLDRRVRAALVAPVAVAMGVTDRSGIGRLDCAVRARCDHARDQRRGVLRPVFARPSKRPSPPDGGALDER
jgi:hypothetical protein